MTTSQPSSTPGSAPRTEGAPPEARPVLAALRAYVASRVPAQEVDDVVQDVLVRWLDRTDAEARDERQGTAAEPVMLRQWLLATARNRTIDWLRQRGRGPTWAAAEVDELAQGEAEPAPLAALARCLDGMVDQLAPDDRALLARVDRDGESQADLARELGLSASGARARVQRARARLRAVFDACCELETDRRGGVVDWRRRVGAVAPPVPTGCGCGPAAAAGESGVVSPACAPPAAGAGTCVASSTEGSPHCP